jgi:hypothetical protein
LNWRLARQTILQINVVKALAKTGASLMMLAATLSRFVRVDNQRFTGYRVEPIKKEMWTDIPDSGLRGDRDQDGHLDKKSEIC